MFPERTGKQLSTFILPPFFKALLAMMGHSPITTAIVLSLLRQVPFADCLPTATVAAGVLIGTTTRLPLATATVNQFLGIPFAASPPERFSPPENASPWTQPLNVTAWKPACIQQFVCE